MFEHDYFRQTAYHWAAKRGYKKMLQILLDRGSYLNQYDMNNRTPLWLAAKNNHFECCEMLLQYGANPFMENTEGKKPIDVVTDSALRKLITQKMENSSDLNQKASFHKLQLAKKMKDGFFSLGKHQK